MKESYPIYISNAFILHTKSVGESDRYVTLLLEDGRIINTYAKSIRNEGAKLRSVIKPYGYISISIIIGKRNIIKDACTINELKHVWKDKKKYSDYVNLLLYINNKVLPSEHLNEVLFNTVKQFIFSMKKEYINGLLLAAKTAVLSSLGYMNEEFSKENINNILDAAKELEKKHKDLFAIS